MKRNMKEEVVDHRLLNSSSSMASSVQLRAEVSFDSREQSKKRKVYVVRRGVSVCVC